MGLLLRRASRADRTITDRIGAMRMAALLSRNSSTRPGVIGTARVDRDIDKLLQRVEPGDIVVLDVLDLDRATADALVDANIAGVVNASTVDLGPLSEPGPRGAGRQRHRH